jgi:hypothetical protein
MLSYSRWNVSTLTLHFYGSTDFVKVETDHQPLVSVVKKSDLNYLIAPKLLRRLWLQSFSYRLVYRPLESELITDS